jgi:C_GCAxxG_C_C family probable redox protein
MTAPIETECAGCQSVAVARVSEIARFDSQLARDAARDAAELYDRGVFCAEAVLQVVNARAPHPMPDDVVRLGTGFCGGMGGAGCSCGALAGGVMAVGLLAGRNSLDEPWEPSYYPAHELHDRFRRTFGATCCRTIVRPLGGLDGEGRHDYCVGVTGAAAGFVIELAEREGWLDR